MDLGLKGKSVVIVGASRGIGLGIARSFATEGARVALVARGAEALEAAAASCRDLGAEAVAFPADVTRPGEADLLIPRIADRFGGIDALVGNAGGNRRGMFADTTDEDWEAVLDLNLRAHIRTARAALKAMSSGGSITFIASIFGREAGGPGLSIYNTTKSAIISLAKIMAMELAERGIRVNSVAPGSIRFEGGSWDRRCKEDPDGMAVFIRQNLPMGRFGTVEEIADVVTFLASERASWISGACLNVDGVQSKSLI